MTLAESSAVVGELRRARRKQRVAAIHWVDALYQVYVTGLVGIILLVLVSGAVGDGPVAPATVDDVLEHGPATLGLLAAFAVFLGLRSGSRGGPLALERPDVRHVLLSPVDRGIALRGPAWRQLRFLVATGAGVGAGAGLLALRRLPGNDVEWLVAGALFGVTIVGLGYGSALLASGLTLPAWLTTALGGSLVAWQVADLTGHLPAAPGSIAGRIPLWPLDVGPLGLIAVGVAAALVAIGMRFVAGTSLEAAERRTALVGQMRFAVTLQDLRTVLVLRRQLAQERPRSRPWIRASGRRPRFPVWQRGVRSVMRWPSSRLVRVSLMAVVAGLSLRGAWAGTSPLIVLAGLALWVAALDAAESLGQEIDHPGRTDAFPMERGELMAKHLPIIGVVSVLIGLLAAVVALIPIGDEVPAGAALVVGLAAGLLAACGATVSVVQGAPDPVDTLGMATPEIAGVRTVFRTAFPPALAVLGTLPLLAARAAERGVSEPPPLEAAIAVLIPLVALTGLVGGWVRFRDDIRASMAAAMESASPTKMVERQAEERRAAEEREAAALAESRRLGERQSASRRAKTMRAPARTPEGAQGGTSAKPIGRRRDQQ